MRRSSRLNKISRSNETAEARNRVHSLPQPKFGHREKFGTDPEKHRDFSAVTHVTRDKGIPPFLLLYVAGQPDTSAQAQRLGNVLKDAGVPVTLFGAKETTHSKISELSEQARSEPEVIESSPGRASEESGQRDCAG